MDPSTSNSTVVNTKPSGNPRPTSRLPLPRVSALPTAPLAVGVRPVASSDRLRAGGLNPSTTSGDIRAPNSRLRSSASRDQIRPPTTLRKPQRPTGPPVSSQTAIRDAARPLPAEQEHNGGTFKQSAPARRKPSGQQLRSAFAQLESPIDGDRRHLDEDHTTLGRTPSQRQQHLKQSPSRPSLAERTIETLSQLPSSPALKRRGSNFFESEQSRRPASRAGSSGSRPGSSYQSDGSTGPSAMSLSRPGSSSGPIFVDRDGAYSSHKASASTKPSLSSIQGTPSKRSSTIVKTPDTRTNPALKPSTSSSKLQSRTSLPATSGPQTPSAEKHLGISVSQNGSKTMTARPLKPRASMNGLFKKPSMPSLQKSTSATNSELPIRPPRKVSMASVRSSATSGGDDRNLSSASTASTVLTVDSIEESPASSARKSSAILREQIAKAKAAKRAASLQASGSSLPPPDEYPVVPTDNSFDFGLTDDPFGQKQFEDSNRKVMQTRIDQARTTGRLNISAMGLKQIPDEVLKMYDLGSIGGNDASWAESVDLSRFVAADNELEAIDDSVFPDTDPAAFIDDDDSRGLQFGGLESLDLHGNMLIALPLGLRRLQLLTSLNLTQNKLANGCLDTISQVVTLRDLKLGKNLLYGVLDSCFTRLENLEILDLHGNNITGFPEGLENLSRLRMLNVNENAFESLPFKTLSKLPLTELLARKNKLRGVLIEAGVHSLSQLQSLDIAANQVTLLTPADTPAPLSMPSLHQLTLSMNRIQSLPDISSWKKLMSLTADENSIAAIPDGFTGLESLRQVDFTSNDIRIIPPEIALMDGLALLRITGNPLKDKKFTSLTTEELKTNLALRLEPIPGQDEGGIEQFPNGFDPVGGRSFGSIEATPVRQDDNDDSRSDCDDFATPPTSAPASPARSRSQTLSSQSWPIKPGGILDRANTQSSSLHPVICSKIAQNQTIREIRLEHNTFTNFPNSLSFFADTLTSLCLSHNQLVGESFLTEELDLTALRELNLSQNHITSLAPLTTHLRAPNLQKLDVSCNRIVSLPVLRDFLPSLTVLLVSNNHLEDLDPDTISGMNIVDASSNDIAHLNPRIGLLGGSGNLARLEVNGNRFRVPRWNILERGTDATLRWLRGRVPVAEMAEWRTKAGNADESGSLAEFD